MRSVLLIMCFTCASALALPAPRTQHVTISGRVAAYSGALACLNGNGYWSIIIRVQHPKNSQTEFVRVDFSLPCDKSPDWVSAKPPIQTFHLFRQKDCDTVLSGTVTTEPKLDSAMPIWSYPPDTEHTVLPFGQVVPCYHSIDLPLTPVL
jgi:hypothetical protein